MIPRCKFVHNLPCEQVSERINELEDENARLRSCLSDDAENASLIMGENKELRELCMDINKAAHMLCEAWEGSCSKEAEGMSLHAVCPIGDTNELCVFGKLYDRIREMGVDVK